MTMYLSVFGVLMCARARRQQEATKFKVAMADPEFQSMLRDYMEEMQDPKQRAVSEAGRGCHFCTPRAAPNAARYSVRGYVAMVYMHYCVCIILYRQQDLTRSSL